MMIEMMRPLHSSRQQGFTLVEMIIVIVITGIIGGMVAIFIKAPVQGYVDSARRAEMTDIADTALHRITRDLRLALPNSVRVTGTCSGATTSTCFIEFLPTGSPGCPANTVCLGGGRYRSAQDCSAACTGNILDFTNAADNSFDVLGQGVVANAGDYLVIYNLGTPSASGCPSLGADAYEGCNRRTIVSGGNTITFGPTLLPFPFDSCQTDPLTGRVGGCRFHVISTPVTYVCDGAGTLWRYWGYAIQAGQPNDIAAAPLSTALHAKLATNVSSCSFTYTNNVVAQRSGLVTMNLGITESSEKVTLYNATHVSNVP